MEVFFSLSGFLERAVSSMKLILRKKVKENQHTYDKFEPCPCTAVSLDHFYLWIIFLQMVLHL